jgi:hypothetical protein
MSLSPVEARALLDRIVEPYPEEVFTPLSPDERATALNALHALDFYASERLHAEWARHLVKVAHARLREEGIPGRESWR